MKNRTLVMVILMALSMAGINAQARNPVSLSLGAGHASASARQQGADGFNLAAKEGSVSCKGDGISFISINKDRSQITIAFEGDEAPASRYKVVNRESDGDTRVSYVAVSGSDKLVLSFDDQGDHVVVGTDKYDLKCK